MANQDSAVLAHVAANLKRLRNTAGMSQTALAELAGTSRRTIIKLEAGEANIGLSGLDAIAHALDVTFTDLVASPAASRTEINELAWRGAGPDSSAVLRGSAPATSEVQLWNWSLGSGERYDAQPDPAGWHEIIVVTEGRLRLIHETGHTDLEAGQHAIYPSSQRYSYVNDGPAPARFIRIVAS